MSVGLVMIVKNEGAILPRLAESLKGKIDHWTIVDTGSTDYTMTVAKEVFSYAPGEVFRTEWDGFAAARNVALKAAEPHTDWLLSMDADETFHGEIPKTGLAVDTECIEIEMRYSTLRYWVPRLFRSGRGLAWHGRAHEYIAKDAGGYPVTQQVHWCHIEHHADGGNRQTKLELELGLLTQDWNELHDSRTAFYLARSFDDTGQWNKAATWYRIVLEIPGGWNEERFYSTYRLGVCLLFEGSVDTGCGLLWRAWGEQPHRSEPLIALAAYYRTQALWSLVWQAALIAPRIVPQGLFVGVDAYQWRADYEMSVAAWHVGEIDTGRQLCESLLERDDLPAEIRANIETNQKFYTSV